VIFLEIRKRGSDEPTQITCAQIGKRLADIRERQMNGAIPAENCICCRKRGAEQIEFPEGCSTIERREQASVTRYNLVDDIGSNIPIEMAIGSAYPAKVAAGQVEQCLYLKCFEQTRRSRTQLRGLFVFGTKSRSRSFDSPQIQHGLEDSQAWEFTLFCTIGKA
jgi:hypothetical protein